MDELNRVKLVGIITFSENLIYSNPLLVIELMMLVNVLLEDVEYLEVLREFLLFLDEVFFKLFEDNKMSLPVPECAELDDDFVFASVPIRLSTNDYEIE
jgi:hypothetical protein